MTTTRKLTPYARYITSAVCARRGLQVETVLGPNRSNRVAWARFEIWAILVRSADQPVLSAYSTTSVGQMFGRNHTTVLYGLRRWYGSPQPPSKGRRPSLVLPDPDPPPAGCCLPLTPRHPLPPPIPAPKPIALVKPPRPAPLTSEERRERERLRAREYRRRRRAIGADGNFWLRSLRDQRAGAGDEHV